MYISSVEGLDATTLPTVQLSQALLARAIRLNHCHSEWLGWYRDRRAIEKLLGFKKICPTAAKFALAVAAWQQQNNLSKDGILGWDTLNKMRPLLGKAPLSQEPERPDWIQWIASPNHKSREGRAIDTLIYHATSGRQIGNAINTFKSPDKTSAHYIIARDGQVIQMVALDRAAQHAPPFNQRSVGIEIVNPGPCRINKKKKRLCKTVNMCDRQGKGKDIKRCLEWNKTKLVSSRPSYYRYKAGSRDRWVPYTEQQYRSLIRLTNFLVACIPSLNRITGHEHLNAWKRTVGKNGKSFLTKSRSDPGGSFDWARIQGNLPPWFSGRICHQHERFIKGTKKISPEWTKCFNQ